MSDVNPDRNRDTFRGRGARIKELEEQVASLQKKLAEVSMTEDEIKEDVASVSRELPYHPPKTTKWRWNPKVIQGQPWFCFLSDQMIDPSLRKTRKAKVCLAVNVLEAGYIWSVRMRDWSGKSSEQAGMCQTAEEAVAIAEEVGERRFHELYTPETIKILRMGWTPQV